MDKEICKDIWRSKISFVYLGIVKININKIKPIIVMKLVNVSLNLIVGSLSVVCLSGIAYAVVVGTCNVLGII